MKVVITGASGLVGSALVRSLKADGHGIIRLVRRSPAGPEERLWHPESNQLDTKNLIGADVVVHLAGENIAAGRWTAVRKERIRSSRIASTHCLVECFRRMNEPPAVFVCASAVGIYGNRADEWLTEESPVGVGFLADVGKEWEAAAMAGAKSAVRVACLRFGVILSREGGALGKMLPVFRLGLGGRIGTGHQFWSWITITDVARAIEFVIKQPALAGPVNVVSPEPVTNAEFTAVLGRRLHRPTIVPLPAFAARLALGEMADAALLASARVRPAKLLGAGFRFQHPGLADALADALPPGS